MSCECLLIVWMVFLALSRIENRQGRDVFGFCMSAFAAAGYILWLVWDAIYTEGIDFFEVFIEFAKLAFCVFTAIFGIGIVLFLIIGAIRDAQK